MKVTPNDSRQNKTTNCLAKLYIYNDMLMEIRRRPSSLVSTIQRWNKTSNSPPPASLRKIFPHDNIYSCRFKINRNWTPPSPLLKRPDPHAGHRVDALTTLRIKMEAWVIATEAEEEKNGNPKKRESRNEERETIVFSDGILRRGEPWWSCVCRRPMYHPAPPKTYLQIHMYRRVPRG